MSTELPRDQENRDWTKGNCYYAALEFLKDVPGLQALGKLAPNVNPTLVHGTVNGIKHAWVEFDGDVIDNANDNAIRLPIHHYYETFTATVSKTFTRQEADAILASRPVAQMDYSWHDITHEEIAHCMAAYNPLESPFARDVIFSDPSADTNRTKLQLPTPFNEQVQEDELP